jgi:hypothetical protein
MVTAGLERRRSWSLEKGEPRKPGEIGHRVTESLSCSDIPSARRGAAQRRAKRTNQQMNDRITERSVIHLLIGALVTRPGWQADRVERLCGFVTPWQLPVRRNSASSATHR